MLELSGRRESVRGLKITPQLLEDTQRGDGCSFGAQNTRPETQTLKAVLLSVGYLLGRQPAFRADQ